MGQTVNDILFKGYIKQLAGHGYLSGETTEEYVYRLATLDAINIPTDAVHFLTKRTSFLESVLLNRRRSDLFGLMEQLEDTMIIGLEQSASFSGKESVFCAWQTEDVAGTTNFLGRINAEQCGKAAPVAMSFHKGRLSVACSFRLLPLTID